MVSNDIRLMDLDDLIILALLYDGQRKVDIAKVLGITPPAVCHRMRKYLVMSPPLVGKGKLDEGFCLTIAGLAFAVKAKNAFEVMEWESK